MCHPTKSRYLQRVYLIRLSYDEVFGGVQTYRFIQIVLRIIKGERNHILIRQGIGPRCWQRHDVARVPSAGCASIVPKFSRWDDPVNSKLMRGRYCPWEMAREMEVGDVV